MKIEDRIDRLERIIQRMHVEHVWFSGAVWRNPMQYHKECFCGANEDSSEQEWESLPIRDWPDPDRDRY